jgi:putative SOS response-associated peptidase YedK
MCNLYSFVRPQDAVRRFFPDPSRIADRTGNLPPLPGLFPDYAAPILRIDRGEPDKRELVMARWGMPSPPLR